MLKIIVALFAALSLSACCKPGLSPTLCTTQKVLTDCGSKLLQGKLPGLVAQVSELLEKEDNFGWDLQLDSLVVDGISVGKCVVKKYVEIKTGKTLTTLGVSTKSSALTVGALKKNVGVSRANFYLSVR
jgi:hypothetical protein